MLSRKCGLQIQTIINGGGATFLFKSVFNLSTTTQKAGNSDSHLVDYLVNSLGFSEDAAVATSTKVNRSRPSQEKADSVVSYLGNLGLEKTHIRSMVSQYPSLLRCKVDKTLESKFNFLRDLGLSGSDLIKVVMGYKFVWRLPLDTQIKSQVSYLRQLMGSDDGVIMVLKKYSKVLASGTKTVEINLRLLRGYGITDENIVKLIVRRPRRIFATRPEQMEEILRRAENLLCIPRESAMFHYGVEIMFSFSESTIVEKFEVLRSFGWSVRDI